MGFHYSDNAEVKRDGQDKQWIMFLFAGLILALGIWCVAKEDKPPAESSMSPSSSKSMPPEIKRTPLIVEPEFTKDQIAMMKVEKTWGTDIGDVPGKGTWGQYGNIEFLN